MNWPRFRGPLGTGEADGKHLPVRWSAQENVAWKVDIPGRGWSSPIVWGERIFVTSAIGAGTYKQPSTGIFGNDYIDELRKQGLSMDEAVNRVRNRDIESTGDVAQDIQWMVFCIDAKSGRTLWQQEVARGKPFGGRHRKNTYASETPVTDGERVYVYFGNVGLFAYSMEGKPLWSQRWESRKIYFDFGTAASPALDNDRLYIQNDNDEGSFLAAVDAKTGHELWKVARTGGSGRASGWSSPFVWKNALRTEIIAVGRSQAISYDRDGKELWRLTGLIGQATPTPLADSERLFVTTGDQTGANRPMFAIRPGGTGDISLKPGESSNAYVAWHQEKASSYIPSPLVYRGRVYVVYDNGLMAAFDARSGKQLYKARIGSGGVTFSSSPWAYDGKIFCLSEDGDTFVIEAGDVYKQVGVNSLAEMCLATPAVAHESLFIRTLTSLYRVKNR